MSNRRRAQRRDAHGAPVRTRQEIITAAGTALSVIVVTVVLLFALKHDPASTGSVVTTPISSVPSSSTPAVSDSTATTATTATSAPSTTSTSGP